MPTLPFCQPSFCNFFARTLPISYAPFLLFDDIKETYSPPSVPMSAMTTGTSAFFASLRIVTQADEVVGDTIIPATLSLKPLQ